MLRGISDWRILMALKLKKGGQLKTTGNARKPVSGAPKSVKTPGLPGLGGLAESGKVKKPGSC